MARKFYPDDLTENEWKVIGPIVDRDYTKGGRPLTYTKREFLNAIFYWLRTGCSWRHLPHDFPPWKSVYTQFRRWRIEGFFERIENYLREKIRKKLKRQKEPSVGIIDSQTVKTTEKGGSKVMMVLRRLRAEKGIF